MMNEQSKIRRASLRTKIIAWSFVPTAIILVVVAVVIFYAYQQVTEDLVIERNRELTRLAAGQFTAELKEYANLLDNEARRSDVYGNDPVAQRDALKGARNRLAVFDGGVLILDTFGTVVAVEPERPEVLKQNWSDRTYYRQMLRSQILGSSGPVFSDIVADRPGNTEVIVVAVPIIGPQGEFVGTLAGMFPVGATTVSAFYGDIVKLRIGESGSAYLVDGNGRVIYHTDTDRIADDISAQEIVQQVLNGEVGVIRTHDFEGRDIVASFAPVPGTSWGLVTQESWAALTHSSRGYGQFLLLLLALGVVVPALVVAVGVRRITRPIAELIGAVQEVARGNFGQTITARTGDEIEELAEQFNLMAAQLQKSYAQLEQRLEERRRAEALLKYRSDFARLVSDISTRFVGLTPEQIDQEIEQALEEVVSFTVTDSGYIFRFSNDYKRFSMTHLWHRSTLETNKDDLQELDATAMPWWMERLKQSEVVAVSSVDDLLEEASIEKGIIQSQGIQSLVDVPMSYQGEVIGFMGLSSVQKQRVWSDDEINLLKIVGQVFTNALQRKRAEEALRRYTEQLEALRQASLHLTSSLALQPVLDTVLEHAFQLIAADDAHIFLYDGENLTFGAAFWAGDRQEEPYAEPRRDGLTYTVARTSERIVVPDVDSHPLYQGQGWSWGGAIIGLPLRIGERVCGVMSVAFERPHTFDESELRVLELLADQTAVAIENARLHEQIQQHAATLEQRVADRTKELATLNAVAGVVSRSLDLQEILNDALNETLQVMEIEAGGIYLLDEEAGVLTIAAQRGFSPQLASEIDGLKVGEGFSGRVAQSGQPLAVRDISKYSQLTHTVAGSERFRSLASVPLSSKGKVLGTLFAATHGYREFTDQDVQLLTSIGHQIGVAIENARLFNAEQRRAEQFRVMSEVGRRVTSILAVDELLVQMVGLIQEAFNYYLVEIGLVEEDEVVFKARAERDWDSQFESFSLKVGEQGITGWVAATGEPLLVPDVSQEPRYIKVTDTETRSELAVPIKAKERITGVINVESDHLNAFDESDLAVLQSLAHEAAIAVENARLFEAERRRRQEATLLAEIAKLVSGTLDLDEVLRLTTEYAVDVFDVHCCCIFLYDEGKGTLRSAAQIGFDDQVAATLAGAEFSPSEGMRQRVFEALQPLVLEDVPSDPHLSPQDLLDLQSALVVPIEVGGRRLGAMQLGTQWPRRRRFTAEEGELAMAMANQAAMAIENARLFETEERRAEQFRVISEVGRRMTSILAPDELLWEIAGLIKETLGYYLVGIGLIEKDELIFKAGAGGIWEIPRFQPPRLKVGEEGITGWVAQSGEPLLVPDVSQEPRYYSLPEASEIRSELSVPLKTKERVIGVLHVQSNRLDAFDESDLGVLQSLAHQAAIAIENAQLYEQAQELAVVEERSRLARDLHDAVTQTLFSASLIADVLPRLWERNPDEGQRRLQELRELTRGALAEMRTLLLELRPAALSDAELSDLLRQLAESITGRARVPVTVAVEGQRPLPLDVKVALYRIAHEALNNVAKHGGARQATVSLNCQPKQVELHVSDDGRGFDPEDIAPESLGLGIMRERAEAIGATLTVESEIGHGTKVMVVWIDTTGGKQL